MKTLLVTSAVTFVPKNYDTFILAMAESPHVEGLLIVDNRTWDIVVKALLLLISGAAPSMGKTLLKNYFDNSLARKKQAYSKAGKNIWVTHDINSEETISLISSLQIDLILNARTRSFFKKKLLTLPRLGCLNIHHGLLPNQRGLMCDFWAHLFNTAAGFSIHQMTPKLDDGSILKVVEVPSDKKDYLNSLQLGAALEATTALQILEQIAQVGSVHGEENKISKETVYHKNPGIRDFFRLRLKGTKI